MTGDERAQADAIEQLRECRDLIDDLDRRLLHLLNERTKIVERIGRVKQSTSMPIYEPKREDEVFANIVKNNAGPLPDDAAKRVFERIIDEMRTIQRQRMLARKQGDK
ncbi:MAG: chorismate mutase [Bryobacteraceae bacterium]